MSDRSSVRVRYAPSPTGYLHVGGVRTLLFNYLYAQKHQGTLILRIEDTDQARSTPENERMLLEDVQLLGLEAQESPQKGGPHVPYRQSERLKIYGEYVQKLLDSDRAYYCFCPAEMIAEKREAALKMGKTPVYDGTCARLSRADAVKRIEAGEAAGIRFRALQKSFVLQDAVRGEVEFKAGTVGDFLITRSPLPHEKAIGFGIGMPVYNFCCVIDDSLMGMTHIIRGEDHLANTARQLMLYDAFQFRLPVFAHTAMVLGSDRQKLSKRNGDTSARDYLNQGYLKEALLNFLAFLGWHPKSELKPRSGHAEILMPDELAQAFDISGLQKAPAVFDVEKLKWMNAQYMRLLPASVIAERARSFFDPARVQGCSPEFFERMIDILRMDHGLLSELPAAAEVFLSGKPALTSEGRAVLSEPSAAPVVQTLIQEIEKLPESFGVDAFEALQKQVGAQTQVKGKQLFMPIRVALTGDLHGPEMKKLVPLIGKKAAIERIQHVLKEKDRV